MQNKHIYIFSGLGADERVFQRFDFSDYTVHFIKWISVHKNETIEAYATRILSQITHRSPLLVGLSFGGIMAIEVAKQIRTEKLILISSVKSKAEIPFYYRFAGKLNLHKLLPPTILKTPNAITNYFFGVTSSFEKQILRQILVETDSLFLKWAINSIVKWKNVVEIDNLKHIHGTKDKILPFCYVNANYTIQGGGHLMTLSHTKEIMEILKQEFVT